MLVFFFLPTLSFAAGKTVMDIAKMLTTYINMVIALMITAGLVIFLFSALKGFGSSGEGKSEFKRVLIWGVIALFVMVSVWGLVTLIKNTIAI